MNDAHFHLAVNHLPIIVPGIGILVLLGGLIFKSEAVKRTAYCLFILGALSTFVALSSGEGAEEVMEKIGSDHHMIHEHEEAAETFALFSHALGLISIIGLWASYKRKKISVLISAITIAIAAGALWFGSITATSGGEISHPEIRNDITGKTAPEHEHDDH